MAPTPGPGGTDIHVPGPGDIDPQQGFDAIAAAPDFIWKLISAIIIIAVGGYIINKLPWKPIGLVAIAVIVIMIFAK